MTLHPDHIGGLGAQEEAPNIPLDRSLKIEVAYNVQLGQYIPYLAIRKGTHSQTIGTEPGFQAPILNAILAQRRCRSRVYSRENKQNSVKVCEGSYSMLNHVIVDSNIGQMACTIEAENFGHGDPTLVYQSFIYW